MNWEKELPQTEGDYLWVVMWSCNCCIRRSGVVAVLDKGEYDKDGEYKDNFHYTTKDDKVLTMFGPKEDLPDFIEGKPDVDGWLKLTDLPEARDD